MAIILFGTRKGGPGKTTTGLSLAGAFANRGESVCFVDADKQRTGERFINRRNRLNEEGGYKGQQVPFIKSEVKDPDSTIAADLRDLATRYDHVIVDTGGYESRSFTTGVQVADVVYIPMKPSIFDLEQIIPTLNAINSIEQFRRDQGNEGFTIDVRLLPCRITQHDTSIGSESRKFANRLITKTSLSSCMIKQIRPIEVNQAYGLTISDLKLPQRSMFELLADEVIGVRPVAIKRNEHKAEAENGA